MAIILDLRRRKGDTYPIMITVADANQQPVDITGMTFALNVTQENNPNDTNYVMQLTGAIIGDPTQGVVSFPLSALQAATTGTYYYIVEQTDGTEITTVMEGAFAIDYVDDIIVVGTNSYGSLAEADAYFNASIRSATWDGFNMLRKQQGIVEAVRVLERVGWGGTKEVDGQALHFPATGLSCNGTELTGAESLEKMKIASFEYAYALLLNPALLDKTSANGSNIKELKAGSARIQYMRSVKGTRFPTTVQDIVKCFIKSAGAVAGIGGAAATGLCDDSYFASTSYDRTEGYY